MFIGISGRHRVTNPKYVEDFRDQDLGIIYITRWLIAQGVSVDTPDVLGMSRPN